MSGRVACTICGKLLPRTLEFFASAGKGNKPSRQCKGCRKKYAAAYYRKHKAKVLETTRRARERRYRANPIRYVATEIVRHAKRRAGRKGIPFDVTVDDIEKMICEQLSECPSCKTLYSFEQGKGHKDNSPSIDQRRPGEGYTQKNTGIICWRCNKLKSDGTLIEFRCLVRYLEN